jgi:hypothetical protein
MDAHLPQSLISKMMFNVAFDFVVKFFNIIGKRGFLIPFKNRLAWYLLLEM